MSKRNADFASLFGAPPIHQQTNILEAPVCPVVGGPCEALCPRRAAAVVDRARNPDRYASEEANAIAATQAVTRQKDPDVIGINNNAQQIVGRVFGCPRRPHMH